MKICQRNIICNLIDALVNISNNRFPCRCFTHIGRQAGGFGKWSNGSIISLGNQCLDSVIVKHEIMHSIGFFHEHCRPDRDDYISINLTNIESGILCQRFTQKNEKI